MRGRALVLSAVLVCAGTAAAAPAGGDGSFQLVPVKPGDTLWGIAQRYLQDPARWDEVLAHNPRVPRDPMSPLPEGFLRVPVRLVKERLRAAHLTQAVREVAFRRNDSAAWKEARLGMELYRGDALRTREDSRARVRLLDREILSLEPNSMAIVKPAGSWGDVELKEGSIFAGRAKVVTGTARIVPRTADTRYAATIAPDLTTRVDVYQGLAAVNAQGREVEVPEGMGTVVRAGLAPELPKPIEDLPALETRALEHESALSGASAAPSPRAAAPPPEPEADAASLRAEIRSLSVGVPVLGYRVQAARDREFAKVLFDRRYDADERFSPAQAGLEPGAYWWRAAAIDLLGAEGRFTAPRYYSVGVEYKARGAEDLRKAVVLLAPAEDAAVKDDKVRVSGILRDESLSVEVDGKPVRIDGDGNFTAEVPLRRGLNEIVVRVRGAAGAQTSLSRRVVRQ